MSTAVATRESVEIRLQSLLGKLQEKAPEETKQLGELVLAIQHKDIAILGEDEAFKLRDSSGEIRAFRSVLHLSATDGTLVQPVPGGPFVISAQGYEKWEESAGAITMKPPQVLVGGQMMQNPHVERDQRNNRLLAIHCRTIAFRFTSKGIPQVSDWTTIFDVPAYRLIDLLAKAKKFPQAFRLLPTGMKPDVEGNQTWAAYEFDESTTLWVNSSHDEALNFYSQIINREKKAMDFAQTFSKRNSLKHLSGLQKVPGQENGPISRWSIPVISWRPTSGSIIKWDMTRYASVSKALVCAAGGDTNALMIEASKGSEFVGEDPGADKEFEEIEQADGDGGGNGKEAGAQGDGKKTEPEAVKPEAGAAAEEKKEPAGAGQKQESWDKLQGSPMDRAKALEKADEKLFKEACAKVDIFRPMSDAAAIKILKAANEISKGKK